jgi:DNA polymerase-4
VRTAEEEILKKAVGSWAESLRRLSFGDDRRAVEPHRERKSIGCEETYARDLADAKQIASEVEALARHAAGILERKEMTARTVVLKVRYANFETITRSETREPSTRDAHQICARATALLEKTEAGRRSVRLLGVSLHGLRQADSDPAESAPDQFSLPVRDENSEKGAHES